MHLVTGHRAFTTSRCVWLFAVLLIFPKLGSAQSLRYAPKPGAEFRYQFDIKLDLGTEETVLEGVTTYRAEEIVEESQNADTGEKQSDQTDSDPVRLQFTGGLRQTERSKNTNRFDIRPRFPPFGMRSGPVYRGTTPTSNTVTLSPTGETLALQGESQLPYLLGHLSLLPFEPLPEENQTQWSAEGTTAIVSSKTNNHWGPGHWSALGAFPGQLPGQLPGQNDRDLRVANTKRTYRIVSQDDRQAVIEKTEELSLSPAQENATLQLRGTGTWVFDKTERMPLSMDFRYDLTIELSGLTVKAPLTLKYKRLTAEEIAQQKAAAEKRAAESKRLAEQRKQEAERDVTEEEKQNWLVGLRSEKNIDRVRTLNELVGRRPPQRDPEIVAAIKSLLDDSDRSVSLSADRALKQWDPLYAEQAELESKYANMAPLNPTGRTVDKDTPLYVGQVIQVQFSRSWWRAAEITELLQSGRVEVEMRLSKDRKIFDREEIQLPPEAYIQPKAPPANGPPANDPPAKEPATMNASDEPAKSAVTPSATAKPLSPMRTWKDASGRFSIEAELLLIANGNLVLSRADGKLITVAIEKMSQADQTFVKELSQPADEPVNPFEFN
ncbi:SHD1 domain-containing protein [Neorhodopirellula pilleata]|uniref:SLA1 homology domain-containing protein n=1 Tax=Neorhodopirellula pilleata TaxID=2714738 RepID=A0A5C6ADJ4_9BACT|nr:SHD1 domain-containing protein [Neorhodopirellula pilleata]TWT97476.1 hypothetical protein Pla100_26300 [Neorhodopirellula pilleata]